MDSQEKVVQNSRNNAARLRKLEKKNYAKTSYFEVGIEKNTPPVATVPSQIASPKRAWRPGNTSKHCKNARFPAGGVTKRGVFNGFARNRSPELEK